jgi:predicted RNase H-like HicB family nuclease
MVRAIWDDEAHVWVATSEDVPGFVTEADTLEQLRDKALPLLEELIELNNVDLEGAEIPVHIFTEMSARVTNPRAAAWDMAAYGFTPQLIRFLREHGCMFVRKGGRGDHEIWYSPISKRRFPVDANIRSRHTANEVLKQAGIQKQF